MAERKEGALPLQTFVVYTLRIMAVSVAEARLHLQSLERAARAQGEARARRLLQAMPRAREVLVERHGARAVWLFGSLVTGNATAHSDVDLAVEGLPAAAYFKALADLMSVFGGPVDLVCLERAPASLRERVALEGLAL